MNALGVAHLTALALDPFELVRQSARVGFTSVGLRLHPAMVGGLAYPMKAGSEPVRRLKALLGEEGVRIGDVEFVELKPDVQIDTFAGLLEVAAELGARSLTVSGDDYDVGRLTDHFAALCQLAAGYDLRVDLEFMRWRAVGNLQQAERIVSAADQPNGAILVDALHLFRSGGDAQALAQVDRRWLSAAQLCDAPAQSPPEDGIIHEAREGRLPPGAGQLPLASMLAALPAVTAFSVEMPAPTLPVEERLALAYRAARALLSA